MKRTLLTRLLVLLSVLVLTLGFCTLGAAATDQAAPEAEVTEAESTAENRNPTNEELGGFFSPMRIEYAVTVTLQGMLMIFAVLGILWGVVSSLVGFLFSAVLSASVTSASGAA